MFNFSSNINMNNRELYKQLCNTHPEIPLFMQYWWMEAACKPDSWNVLFCGDDDNTEAVLVFHIQEKLGIKRVIQPTLTQYNGIWINYPKDISLDKRYDFENRVMENLINQLDAMNLDFYEQKFHYSFTNWQPFYWKQYKQTTHYTYLIENIADRDVVFAMMSHKKRQKKILSSEDNFTLDTDMPINDFYEFCKNTIEKKQHAPILYTFDTLRKIYDASVERNQGMIFTIRDKENNIHCSLFTVWDDNSAYNLIIAINPKYKSSGASSCIIWMVMDALKDKTLNYDFEGSMIQGVAFKNQSYGAKQIPYSVISKSSCKYNFIKSLRNLLHIGF